jgi:hypothetical protein
VANAATLFDQTDLTSGPLSFNFVAGSSATTIDFAGYDVPSFSDASDIQLVLQGTSTNLLGTTFAFTPASCGSDTSQGPAGAFGTNNLSFGGVCTGSYDSYAQTIATTIGDTYTLAFQLFASGYADNGLRVTASDAQEGAVPEPATWAMMVLGAALVGASMRHRQRTTVRYNFA